MYTLVSTSKENYNCIRSAEMLNEILFKQEKI